MKTWFVRFNIYLWLALVSTLGCQSPKNKQDKELAMLRLHLEVIPDGTERSKPVPIFREKPIPVNVDQTPCLDERDAAGAKIVDWMGSFFIQIQFDWHGTLVLDNITSTNPNRRIAVQSQFGKPVETRWLAAPVISRRISDGVFSFSPDTSREEAERIVRGLNNTVAKIKKRNRF